MDTVELIGLLVPVTYLVMLGVESLWPARAFPPRPRLALDRHRLPGPDRHRLDRRAAAAARALAAGASLDRRPRPRRRRRGRRRLGRALRPVVRVAPLSHAWGPLWRVSHQIHHSPQRIDISGSTLFHPVEMVIQVLLQTFVTVIVLGLDPLAAALVGYVAAFHGLFQHWNVATPRWLGVLIQRPEAHCEHHRLGVHANNYGDFPLWDLLLGTFRNPARFEGECGFEAPADRRLLAMLAWQDVNARPTATAAGARCRRRAEAAGASSVEPVGRDRGASSAPRASLQQ
jgi:hypothetical protein